MVPKSLTTHASGDEEEDDYMSMAIAEPSGPKQKETYTQRRVRKAREVHSMGFLITSYLLASLSLVAFIAIHNYSSLLW